MAKHVHTTPRPLKAAPYRSDPMPDEVMDIMNRIGARLEARAAERTAHTARTKTRAELRTGAVVDLAAFRRARA